MARIAGIDLPRTKRVEIGLTYIFGIGRVRSNKILAEAGVSGDIRIKDLSEDDVRKISRVIEEQGGKFATTAHRVVLSRRLYFAFRNVQPWRLHAAIDGAGLMPRGAHHEIYLGDPTRSAPERLRTMLRHPVEPADAG